MRKAAPCVQLKFRMPPALHRRLVADAKASGRSLNAELIAQLSDRRSFLAPDAVSIGSYGGNISGNVAEGAPARGAYVASMFRRFGSAASLAYRLHL